MSNLENLFNEVFDMVDTRTKTVKKVLNSATLNERFESLPSGPQREYILQSQIRPIFGKDGINSTPIGTHPDFLSLENGSSRTINQYVCTLFVDIKGSTRLSLLYPLDLVYKFKDAVIKTCVEVIRSLDGSVHRIMGDAVMAFFGGNATEKEDAIADAINCATTLRAVLEGSIKPWMVKNGIDAKDFGFRVGCDFGDDSEVLWGSFGYSNVGEVSATGLPVDMASKLQGLASKNQTMIGQGILNFINWPENYSKIKENTRSCEEQKLPVVTPNLTDKNGNPINYQMRLLRYEAYLECSALPRQFKEVLGDIRVINHKAISYKCYTVANDNEVEYFPSSKFLEKNVPLVFKVVVNTRINGLSFPLTAIFTKMNNGKDVPIEEREKEYPPVERILRKPVPDKYNKSPNQFVKAILNESTLYRGLHTMKCEIVDRNKKTLFRDWIGVMIK
ncbi:adenylate/guanylate cyclase domain-containing protein [uncultured Desulfuromonas sp.]|uniref:nucleotide-binding domain-containing protein n=1 Tax=uncultured Desulfuromonas sp. TaxID=181013 RepID=UPI002AAA9E2B|nr:adenylate/guanylate cyclase domain-containing protein [uncultured Desulfuromonas sp.]